MTTKLTVSFSIAPSHSPTLDDFPTITLFFRPQHIPQIVLFTLRKPLTAFNIPVPDAAMLRYAVNIAETFEAKGFLAVVKQ